MNPPATKAELDQETTGEVIYSLVVVAPHLELSLAQRRALREAFEQSAQLLQAKLVFAGIGLKDMRATRWSRDFDELDVLGHHTDYPET